MHTISDAGLVFTPGGNYVITLYMHDIDQLLWDPANIMVGKISSAVYNFFNLPLQ
jgi:hypothetical protein